MFTQMSSRHALVVLCFTLVSALYLVSSDDRALSKQSQFSNISWGYTNISDCCPFLKIHSTEKLCLSCYSEYPEAQFQALFDYLKRFVMGDQFELRAFENDMDRLGQIIIDMVDSNKAHAKTNEHLSYQTNFVISMFQAMNQARYQLILRNQFFSEEQVLLGKLIDYDVRLFALFDSYGVIDKSVSGYGSIVVERWRTMTQLVKEFEDLVDVSDPAREMFEGYRIRAESKLDELWRQVPADAY
ncbi:hypothetical protein OXX79_001419 [Metschnikowia pulcherrima]